MRRPRSLLCMHGERPNRRYAGNRFHELTAPHFFPKLKLSIVPAQTSTLIGAEHRHESHCRRAQPMSLRVINGGTEPLAHWSAYPPRLSVIADMPAPPPMPGTNSCTGSKIHAYSI